MDRIEFRAGSWGAAAAAICSSVLLVASDSRAAAITLAWDAGAAGTAGYYVYCGEASRTYSSRNDVGTATTIKVDGLVEAETYYCAVTAYSAARVESGYSNEVSATIASTLPVIQFGASPASGRVPTTVAFSNATTGEVTSWSWNFGDGGSSTERTPTHTYTQAGQYWVTLTATGPGGTTSKTLTTAITIKRKGKP